MSIANRLLDEPRVWIEHLVVYWPEGSPIGARLRRGYWARRLASAGARTSYGYGTRFDRPDLIHVGTRCSISHSTVSASESLGIFIGDEVLISSGCFLRAGLHAYSGIGATIRAQGHECEELEYAGRRSSIVIEDDVWLQPHSVVLSGAWIGRGSVILANSVVHERGAPGLIMQGNPARRVGQRARADGATP